MNLSNFLSGLAESVKGIGYWIGDLFNNRSHDASAAQIKRGGEQMKQSGIVNAFESLINKETGAELTGAQREANQFSHDERIDAQNWTAQREDTLMQRTVQDYQAAGINPMALAGGNVAAQPSGSSGASSVSPPSGGGLSSLLQVLEMKELLPLQKEALQKDIANKAATTANIQADTAQKNSVTARNNSETALNDWRLKFSKRTEDLEVRIKEEQEKMNHAQWRLFYKQIDKAEADITHLIEQAHTEQEKQLYYKAQTFLANAEVHQINALLASRQALLEAQGEQARAAAALNFAETAVKQGLLDAGYVDAFMKELNSDAST